MITQLPIKPLLFFISIVIIFFASFHSYGKELNSSFHESIRQKNIIKIIVVEPGEIKLWHSKNKNLSSLFKNKKYLFDASNVSIECPSFCFNHDKLLFARNILSGNKGSIIILNLKNGTENILYKRTIIKSPTLSHDGKLIAFLSDVEWEKSSLFILEISTKKVTKIKDDVYCGGYNLNISWHTDNQHVACADIKGNILVVDIVSKENIQIEQGYDPIYSPDGKSVLFKKSKNKPYNPYILDVKSKTIKKINISRVFNAIWLFDGEHLLITKNVANIFKWNEWAKEVLLVKIDPIKKFPLFKYEGYEYLACTQQ